MDDSYEKITNCMDPPDNSPTSTPRRGGTTCLSTVTYPFRSKKRPDPIRKTVLSKEMFCYEGMEKASSRPRKVRETKKNK